MNSKKLILFIFIVLTLPVFAQQPDWSLIPYRQGNLWGFAYPDKSIFIKPLYNEVKWFVGGYAVVKKGTKYGYINKTGKVVIPIKYADAKSFRYGYYDKNEKHLAGGKMVQNQDTVLVGAVSLTPGGRELCIDTKGRTMTKCPAINENSVPANRQPVSVTTEKVYSLVNNGNLYDKLVDDYHLPGDDHTYYIGVKNNLYGVINNTFDVIIPFEYQSISKVDVNGTTYLQGQKNGMYGMYKGNGNIFIPVEDSKLTYVQTGNGNGYFIETRNGVSVIKDAAYRDVTDATYADIAYDEDGGFVLTGLDKLKGYYFNNNNRLIKPVYTEVKLLRGGQYIQVTTRSGKTGYINSQGVEFFEE